MLPATNPYPLYIRALTEWCSSFSPPTTFRLLEAVYPTACMFSESIFRYWITLASLIKQPELMKASEEATLDMFDTERPGQSCAKRATTHKADKKDRGWWFLYDELWNRFHLHVYFCLLSGKSPGGSWINSYHRTLPHQAGWGGQNNIVSSSAEGSTDTWREIQSHSLSHRRSLTLITFSYFGMDKERGKLPLIQARINWCNFPHWGNGPTRYTFTLFLSSPPLIHI